MTGGRRRKAQRALHVMVLRYIAYTAVLAFASYVLLWDTQYTEKSARYVSTTTLGPPSTTLRHCLDECRDATVEEQLGCWNYCETFTAVKNVSTFKFFKPTYEPIQGHEPSFYPIPDHHIYITSSFLDARQDGRIVRILAAKHRDAHDHITCNFLSNGMQTAMSHATLQYIYKDWPPNSLFLAVMYNCKPPSGDFSSNVSICIKGTANCTSVPIDVTDDIHPGEGLAVTVKAAFSALPPQRLVEWVELNRLLGVEKFLIYDSGVTGHARDVFKYYESRGIIIKVPFPLLPKLHDTAKTAFTLNKADDFSVIQQATLLSINDALYRFNSKFEFLLNIDLDEVLIPQQKASLPFLAQKIFRNHTMLNTSGVLFPTSWHFADFGPAPVQLEGGKTFPPSFQTVKFTRCTPPTDNQPKSIIRTKTSVMLNWHAVMGSLPGGAIRDNTWTSGENVPAVTHHFRGKCVDKFVSKDCTRMLSIYHDDTSVQPYAERLFTRTKQVLSILGLS